MKHNPLSVFYPLIPFPYVKGIRFTKVYNEIQKSQYYSNDELQNLIDGKIKEIINYSNKNIPFYKEAFKGIDLQNIKSTNDLFQLPILEKKDVREQFKKFASEDLEKKKYFVDFTSGSTGTSVNIYKFRNSVTDAIAFTWRYYNWAGIKFSDRVAVISGITFENKNDFYFYSKNKLILSAFNITPENLSIYAKKIIEFSPVALRGYPSAVLLLTKWMKKNGTKPPKIRSIILSAECLFEDHREEIKNYWNCFVQDIYGQAENVVSIGECEHNRKHISCEFGWMELVDKDGKNVKPGVPGRIIGTGFTNLAMPLIRYDTRDVAILSEEICPCGRTLPIVKSIEGRSEDIILTPEGRMVGRLDAAFKYSKGIELSQIIQETRESIVIKIVKGNDFSQTDIDILEKELRKRLGSTININYEFVDDIERTPLGKLRFVISKVKLEI